MKQWQWTIAKGVKVSVLQGDGKRFVRLFKATWKRIPLKDRRLLMKRWRECPPQIPINRSPLIELLASWARMERGQAARAGLRGHKIQFKSKAMDKMQDDEYMFTIAHELAHCVLDFKGNYTEADEAEYQKRGPMFIQIEHETDQLAEKWMDDK